MAKELLLCVRAYGLLTLIPVVALSKDSKGQSGCPLRLLSLRLCAVFYTATPFNNTKGICICCLSHLSIHCDSVMLYNPISFLIDLKHPFFCLL